MAKVQGIYDTVIDFKEIFSPAKKKKKKKSCIRVILGLVVTKIWRVLLSLVT